MVPTRSMFGQLSRNTWEEWRLGQFAACSLVAKDRRLVDVPTNEIASQYDEGAEQERNAPAP